ncbi:hypothetical protein [uncultured Thiodictyon sp.]|uniref:hypothetical protein n=1 Tax=uncultured Thiodictyon sp. TaxID=1846217 RepID=UPI0025D21103|nr:hypothetical protein [uncultured Thiodictyon sp.]
MKETDWFGAAARWSGTGVMTCSAARAVPGVNRAISMHPAVVSRLAFISQILKLVVIRRL